MRDDDRVHTAKRGTFSNTLPAKRPNLENTTSYFDFTQNFTPMIDTRDMVVAATTRPENLDVDDSLHQKLQELFHDMKNLQCSEFASHLCQAFVVMFKGYKALILFAACSLLIFWMNDIQELLVDQRAEAVSGFFPGQMWFILIIILIGVVKALSGPASKSIITFCLTVLYHVNIGNKVSELSLYAICFITDWILDIIISTTQVHFAAAKFSRSLFLLLRIWVQVVSFLHPIFFVSWIVFQVAYYLPYGGDMVVNAAYASPLALWSVLHVIYKFKVCSCLFCIDFPPSVKKILIVDEIYVNRSQEVLEEWACIFNQYQKRDKPWSVLHGVLRVMKLRGYCSCCLKDRDQPADSLEVDVLWKTEPHALWKSFLPAWLWVYTAEFVLMLDAVFLVPYSWFRYYGLLMIAAVTLCDVDRFFTINYTLKWLNEGMEFDDTVRELIWFKIIKQPFGQLLGCLHVYLIWNDNIRKALYGPGDLRQAARNLRVREQDNKNKEESQTSEGGENTELPPCSQNTVIQIQDLDLSPLVNESPSVPESPRLENNPSRRL